MPHSSKPGKGPHSRGSRSQNLRMGTTLSVLALFLGLAEGMRGQTITEFPIPTGGSVPVGITAGSDGNLWFTEANANKISRITPAGVITEFNVLTINSLPYGITAGPDGNLWFTEPGVNKIGRITTAGVVTEFPISMTSSQPSFITAGPDGNLWFTELVGNNIGRITTAGAVTEFVIPVVGQSGLLGITAGPDGNLWFTESIVNQIGRLTTAGVLTEFPIPTANSSPQLITVGPDGNLWFTEYGANQIGRITTAGVITEFPIPTIDSGPIGIAPGPDGNLWFTESDANQIGRITTAGIITEFNIPTTDTAPTDIAAGPDGNLWFTEYDGNQIGRITTGVTSTPGGLAVDSAGNGVLEPNELLAVEPTWRNSGDVPIGLTGTSSNFTGPAGPTYDNPDPTADYGSIGIGASQQCTNCYSVQITAATRPVQHWDTTIDEDVVATPVPAVPPPTKTWTLHVGESFTDVPVSHSFYAFVETIFHHGITSGCGAGTAYCPGDTVTRQQMAVLLLRALEGPGYTPPGCTVQVFTDVPCTNPFAPWINELAARQVTGGCGDGTTYCPTNPTNRQQMATFLLKTKEGSAYAPPACTAQVFNDVPCSNPFSPWINELVARQVTAGCGGNNYCPTAAVARQQMAVFLTKTFGLVLYGP